jgi:Copper binding proteins, plastocyanin/azurin family
MPQRRSFQILFTAIAGTLLLAPLRAHTHPGHRQDPSAPRILLNQPLRAVEYQLGRLSNEELILVERKDSDPLYRPVYFALLTRPGLPQQYRDEALGVLTRMDKASASTVLLEAIAKVPADATLAADKLLGMLYAQPTATLSKDRETFVKAIESGGESVRRAAYGALMLADGTPDQAWQLASKNTLHLLDLLRSVPQLGKAEALRAALFNPINSLIKLTSNPSLRAEAVAVLGWTRPDAATFDRLAQEVIQGNNQVGRAAAIRSLQAIPEDAWPAAGIEPLARAIVAKVGELPPAGRTEPAALDAIQFGERLAAKLPADTGRAVRRDLRALGVQVVRIQTISEKLSFDLRWFVVEAGKPVQIVLVNPDAMPHNLLVSKPGSLEVVGTAGAAMPMPTDPTVKPFVPNSPLVLHATNLLKEGETARLGFNAPKEAGEYIYVCTFPGHWVRMYGVMLVVDALDAYESKPTIPTDPMTKQPFTSQRN